MRRLATNTPLSLTDITGEGCARSLTSYTRITTSDRLQIGVDAHSAPQSMKCDSLLTTISRPFSTYMP